ncbi:hypothetical protein BO83DRAFT_387108 [Aspergillus eucalypticola CBS 122712]|uniref:Uncharacterized protein n=1 Tax=Aspergillus eucalypticola (strain CBS 122712 / IBT 29274) TaxID=1448314 RepID=A0A317VY82_ASPEC|nr:uncharacterized protein BO83DRAFT_387108 [Aspergillus eucalypticola CBS 122712]PWY77917.1 hypothetical protein BO83DRAFT_387108 [Aspergillus eucalypticola CBS 122712]
MSLMPAYAASHLYINDYLLPLKSFTYQFLGPTANLAANLGLIPVVLNTATDPHPTYHQIHTRTALSNPKRNEPYSLSDELYNHNEGLINRTNVLASRNTQSTGTRAKPQIKPMGTPTPHPSQSIPLWAKSNSKEKAKNISGSNQYVSKVVLLTPDPACA